MARSGRTSVKLEEKVLEFEFEILKVQYNKKGKFYLKLSIQNAHRTDLLSKVTVDVNDSGIQKRGVSLTTDTVPSTGESTIITYKTSKFKYNLPKGFCKNDGKYDVYLLIEVFQPPTGSRGSKDPEKMGEAKFAIYPRTEIPRANLFVRKGEDYYNYSGVLTLLRPLTRASISMHCGRLSFNVAFHEYREPGFVFHNSDEEDTVLSPVPEEPPQEHVPKPVPKEQTPKKDIKANILRQANKQTPPPVSPAPKKPLVKSVDRTTQWTPQETGDDLWSPDTFSRERTFDISVPSSPLLEDPNHPDNKEKTMDSPIGTRQTPRESLPPRGRQNQSSRQPPKKINPRAAKSPTMTSPIPDRTPSHRPDHHVARPGYEEVYIIVHGATSLPSRSDGQDPLPFASLKSIADERGVRKAQSATHATLQPTHSPVWEETLVMEVLEKDVDEEEVILTISDSSIKEKLVTYRIPIKNLIPFHPYHFELVQPTKSIGSGIRAYATIQRRRPYLPRLHNFGFCGLEVVLRGFHRQLMSPTGPLLAVARVVPDYSVYKDRMLSKQSAGITTSTITFPSPHPSAFEISEEQMQGFPQLTTASTGSNQPSWNHTFMFCGYDSATMFTRNSALVLEYYPATSSMTTVTWTIRNPVGFSALLLDNEIFEALTSESGRLGVRVDDLLIQSSRFRSTEDALPSVDLVLRLINTERPDTLTTAAGFTLLPALDSMPKPGSATNPLLSRPTETPNGTYEGVMSPESSAGHLETELSDLSEQPLYQRKKTQILVKEDEYPPSDILETILPEYVLTENDTKPRNDSKRRTQPKNRNPVRVVESNNDMSLTAHQSRELANYREAVKRMAADIATLRSTVSKLQEDNHNLRKDLMTRQQLGEIIQSDIESGAVTTEEFADKFVAVKSKLNSEKGELKKYKDKVQRLQNQLIKANDREKNYLNEAVAAKSHEANAKTTTKDKLQKMKKLENTCLQQEKVIEKMEKLLADYLKKDEGKRPAKTSHRDEQDTSEQVASLLTQENARLRMELEDLKLQNQREDIDKAQLQARLERAESRIVSLESQLEQNSRRWAQERHELSVRLQEHRNGFMRTTQPIGEGHRDSYLIRESTTYSDISSLSSSRRQWRRPTPFVAPVTRTMLPYLHH